MDTRDTRVFAVGNEKGGVGKTTIACNLAAAIGETGRRVLLIDSDPTFRASQVLGADPREAPGTLADIYMQRLLPDQAIIAEVAPNVDLIASGPQLAEVANVLAGESYRELRLRLVLGAWLDECSYDVVLIDTPPSRGLLLTNALQVVDEVVCVVDCTDDGSVQGVVNTLRHVREMRALPGAHIPGVRVLRNHVDVRSAAYRKVMDELDLPGVCEQLGVTLMAAEVPQAAAFRNAAGERRPVTAMPCAPSDTWTIRAVTAIRGAAGELVGAEVIA